MPTSSRQIKTTSIRGKYNLTEEELTLYRAEIVEIEREQDKCRGCDGTTCKQPIKGFIPVVNDKDGYFTYGTALCRYEQERRFTAKTQRLFSSARVPQVYASDTFEDYEVTAFNKRAVDAAHWVLQEEKGLFLYGKRGTGKTKLVAIIANARIKERKPVLFVSVPDLLADIRSAYNNKTASELVDAVKNAPFLVLDDLGAERMTEWVGEQLFNIVNHRYNGRLQTIITSNYSPAEIIKRISANGDDTQGQRIMSRLYDMCERVEIQGEDYRMRNKRGAIA